jgi:hypothetical protein
LGIVLCTQEFMAFVGKDRLPILLRDPAIRSADLEGTGGNQNDIDFCLYTIRIILRFRSLPTRGVPNAQSFFWPPAVVFRFCCPGVEGVEPSENEWCIVNDEEAKVSSVTNCISTNGVPEMQKEINGLIRLLSD